VQRAHLSPADAGPRRIGHFGFFKRGSEALWAGALAWVADGHNAFAGGA
jgi:predicted alpha/beta hydrolase